MFFVETWGCYDIKHGDVIYKNMGMFFLVYHCHFSVKVTRFAFVLPLITCLKSCF